MKPYISIIVAVAKQRAIGASGSIPFHISADLKRFKAITMGKPVVMGRKTFESLPAGALPGRRNIVVTRRSDYAPDGAETAPSLERAFEMASVDGVEEIMVIGGGEIYAQALPSATRIYLTEVEAHYPDADTFFPWIDFEQWTAEEVSEPLRDERTGLSYRFITFRRR